MASRWVASIPGLAGGLGAFVVDALYVAAISQQGATPPGGRFVFVALWIVGAGLLATGGSFVHAPAPRAAMLGLAAAMLFALGMPAIFSFGIAILLCAALVGVAALRAAESAQLPWWVGLVSPLAFLSLAGLGVAFGFAITEF